MIIRYPPMVRDAKRMEKEWTDPQLSIMILYNCTWSILIQ